jgi:hypothetical protein
MLALFDNKRTMSYVWKGLLDSDSFGFECKSREEQRDVLLRLASKGDIDFTLQKIKTILYNSDRKDGDALGMRKLFVDHPKWIVPPKKAKIDNK